MNSNFERALAHTFGWEQGLVDDKNDPGGRTNFGITQKKLNEARAAYPQLNLPLVVDDLTTKHAAEVLHLDYWLRCNCDALQYPVALIVFDAAVNCGVGRAPRWLQQAVRVKVDGIIGAQTLAAVNRTPLVDVITEFHALRALHYMIQDSIDDHFGHGWGRRLLRTHNAALVAAGLLRAQ